MNSVLSRIAYTFLRLMSDIYCCLRLIIQTKITYFIFSLAERQRVSNAEEYINFGVE